MVAKEKTEYTTITAGDDVYKLTARLITVAGGKKRLEHVCVEQKRREPQYHRNLSWLRRRHATLADLLQVLGAENFFETP